MNVSDEVFVCIDCESTGLDPHKDRIIEIAATCFTLQKDLRSFETLVDPECEIPKTSQEIHNISREMVAGKPKIRKVLPQILELIGHHIIIGHGIQFDITLIAQEAQRANIPTTILSNPR
jgi:DNA polymerase-3 subunit epsilon